MKNKNDWYEMKDLCSNIKKKLLLIKKNTGAKILWNKNLLQLKNN